MIKRIRANRMRDNGFTLVELLVVIIIVGILAGIAIPVFLSQQHKAGDAAAESDLGNVALEIETYAADHTDAYVSVSPAALAAANIPIKVSGKTAVYLIQHNNAGFCLAAFNTGGSPLPSSEAAFQGLASTVIYWWDSQNGGLQKTPPVITNYSGCPVTSGLASDAGTASWS
jgi:type IV pilus assembly protein PilA